MSTKIRLSTLAEIKVLSLETLRRFTSGTGVGKAPSGIGASLVDEIKRKLDTTDPSKRINISAEVFKTVGIARQVRIDEQYGTQNYYGIGSPYRPRIVPNNFSVSVTCERLQLDKRNLYDFMTSPEYFYSYGMQRLTGIIDAVYYTYMFIRSKESDAGPSAYDIYALMPVSATKAVTNGDVMISHNLQLTGFKVNTGDTGLSGFLKEALEDSITQDYLGRTPDRPEDVQDAEDVSL
jgi:hypothetical protein